MVDEGAPSQPLTGHWLAPGERLLVRHDMARYEKRPPRTLSLVVATWGWDAAWLALCGFVWELVSGIVVLAGAVVLLAAGNGGAAAPICYVLWGLGGVGFLFGFLRFAHAWRVREGSAAPAT